MAVDVNKAPRCPVMVCLSDHDTPQQQAVGKPQAGERDYHRPSGALYKQRLLPASTGILPVPFENDVLTAIAFASFRRSKSGATTGNRQCSTDSVILRGRVGLDWWRSIIAVDYIRAALQAWEDEPESTV